MRRAVVTLVFAALALLAVIGFRAARFTARRPATPPADSLPIESVGAAERLAAALRIATVSEEDSARADRTRLPALHRYLASTFPRAHATLTREVIGQGSLLYTWPGRTPELPALLLTAHLDVVPVEPGTETRWTHPPFGGEIAAGYIWGRGALDDKCAVLGILEAVETLIARGFTPSRTIYLAFGEDEELGGAAGATRLAALLATRGARIGVLLDEGGVVLEGIVPGVRAPVATIGIGEKGEISLALSVATAGGHSSMPPDWTAIGRLSRAVDRLERHPFPASLDGATRELFENVGREMDWPFRILFANLWLFRPIVERYLLSAPTTAATIRTTLAPTIIEGGTKENVLAAHARAVINLRIRPGETAAGVTERVRRIVDDSAVRIAPVEPGTDPSPISPVGTAEYEAIATAVRQVHPEAVVAPFLVIAQTDARHYAGLTPNIYRFSPLTLAAADLARVHGTNERIAVADYARAIRFYGQVMLNVAR